jgi:hypothetical protein
MVKEKTGLRDDQIFEKVKGVLKEHGIKNQGDIEKSISIYAGKSHQELIAEIIADVQTMKTPRAVSIDIYNMLKSLLGG